MRCDRNADRALPCWCCAVSQTVSLLWLGGLGWQRLGAGLLSWRSRRFVSFGLSGFVCVNPSIRQHRVEKAIQEPTSPGWFSKLIRRTLDSPLTEAQARGWWGLQGSPISVDARPLDTPSSAAILLTSNLSGWCMCL